jgi:hypothetical protein
MYDPGPTAGIIVSGGAAEGRSFTICMIYHGVLGLLTTVATAAMVDARRRPHPWGTVAGAGQLRFRRHCGVLEVTVSKKA